MLGQVRTDNRRAIRNEVLESFPGVVPNDEKEQIKLVREAAGIRSEAARQRSEAERIEYEAQSQLERMFC
jgi:hypothetical protein